MPRLSLPASVWPDCDRAMFDNLIREGSLLDGRGALAGHRPASLRALHYGYSAWLGWIAREMPEALDEDPIKRATPERIIAWLDSRSELMPISRFGMACKALRLVMAFSPDTDWTLHRRLLNRLNHLAKRQHFDRKIGRILHADVIFAAGLALMEQSGMGAPPKCITQAHDRRDGALIAFLIVLPLRRRACVNIEIGRHLLGDGPWHLTLPGALNKTGTVWSAVVPDLLDPIIEDYLTWVRPFLAARAPYGTSDSALWLSETGRRLVVNTLTGRISKATRRQLGVPISPHLFRDAAATTLAHDSPDAARITRSLLGHSTFRMAERHYNHATSLQAGRQYSDLIDGMIERKER